MKETDPQGLYSALGVQSTATAEQIKTAYRQLAKETHPDVSSGGSADKFHRISAAYEILSDPVRRANYDSSTYKASQRDAQTRSIDPICCSRCGQITAQPRYIVFFRVYSFIFGTLRKPVQGIFCAGCAKKEAFKSSIITMFAGWWGVPWGPIHSIGSILTNGLGGKHEQASDERLIWYNALAFLSRGNVQLSYALATMAKKAADAELARDASELASQLERAGADPRQARLVNPWRSSVSAILVHILMAFALPGVVAAAIFLGAGDSDTTSSYSDRLYSPPPTSSSNYEPESPTVSAAPSLPTCGRVPDNGQLLGSSQLSAKEGHSLEIRNGAGGNAIIKIKEAYTGSVVAAFFVASNQNAEITGIPDGQYKVQYAFGDKLDIGCRNFVSINGAGQFPGIESLRTQITTTQIITQVLSYTLYAVPAGNVTPQTISAQEFGFQ